MQTYPLNDGHAIPALGYGVFQMGSEEVARCLPQAVELGYAHIDTANAYFNEVSVGEAIRACGVARDELFVTSKLLPVSFPYERCAADIDATLGRLGLDYLDLLLLHHPYGEYVGAWRALEEAVAAGKVRSIGLSNFPARKVREILDAATIAPAVMQVEINPYWNQHALKAELAEVGMVFEGWYPLGHGDAGLLAEPVFAELADKHHKTPAQVVLRWSLQEGNVVLPKATSPQHMAENVDLFDFELDDEDMARIAALPQRPYYVVPEEAPDWTLAERDFSQQL